MRRDRAARAHECAHRRHRRPCAVDDHRRRLRPLTRERRANAQVKTYPAGGTPRRRRDLGRARSNPRSHRAGAFRVRGDVDSQRSRGVGGRPAASARPRGDSARRLSSAAFGWSPPPLPRLRVHIENVGSSRRIGPSTSFAVSARVQIELTGTDAGEPRVDPRRRRRWQPRIGPRSAGAIGGFRRSPPWRRAAAGSSCAAPGAWEGKRPNSRAGCPGSAAWDSRPRNARQFHGARTGSGRCLRQGRRRPRRPLCHGLRDSAGAAPKPTIRITDRWAFLSGFSTPWTGSSSGQPACPERLMGVRADKVYLIGFMASGKSGVAERRQAARLAGARHRRSIEKHEQLRPRDLRAPRRSHFRAVDGTCPRADRAAPSRGGYRRWYVRRSAEPGGHPAGQRHHLADVDRRADRAHPPRRPAPACSRPVEFEQLFYSRATLSAGASSNRRGRERGRGCGRAVDWLES